jgi:hypothetical protein
LSSRSWVIGAQVGLQAPAIGSSIALAKVFWYRVQA